jgi:RNA-binding protein
MINKQEKIDLRRECHKLKPVIMIGSKGYTEAVAAEIECALNSHELIKIKISTSNKEIRDTITQTICDQHKADLIQQMGHMSSVFRENADE